MRNAVVIRLVFDSSYGLGGWRNMRWAYSEFENWRSWFLRLGWFILHVERRKRPVLEAASA